MADLASRWDRATYLFDTADYIGAARLLAEIVAEAPDNRAVRLLLARAYYHSAQLRHAVDELEVLVAADPSDAYARLLLGRTLQRQSRHADAAAHLRLADAMTGADR